MTTQTTTTFTVIFTNTGANGHVYRVIEATSTEWGPALKPVYMVERNQGSHDPRFFNIYIGEDREYALQLAGFGC